MCQKRFIIFLHGCFLYDNLLCGQLKATVQSGMFTEIVNASWWVVLKFTMLPGTSEATRHFGLPSACWLLVHVQVDQVCKIIGECWHWGSKVLGELAMRGSYLSRLKLPFYQLTPVVQDVRSHYDIFIPYTMCILIISTSIPCPVSPFPSYWFFSFPQMVLFILNCPFIPGMNPTRPWLVVLSYPAENSLLLFAEFCIYVFQRYWYVIFFSHSVLIWL